MAATDTFERVEITSTGALRVWLAAHHARDEAVWLITYKKVVPDKYVSTSDVLDELLAHGWIDGRRKTLDAERTMQLITPRRARYWSRTYKVRAIRLIEEGRMAAPGLARMESDRASGLWNFLDDVDALIKPPDLETALDAHPGARDGFDAFGAATQRFALRWIKLAKTEATRARRVGETAARAARGEKVPGA